MKYQYQNGSEPIASCGLMKAFGTRVLCRAILPTDAYKGPLQLITYNSTDAVAFEIVSVGRGVADACAKMGEDSPVVGHHCDVRSVAADRVNSKDPTGRFWLVPVEDIAATWEPVDLDTPGFVEAIVEIRARTEGLRAPPTHSGEVDLSAG